MVSSFYMMKSGLYLFKWSIPDGMSIPESIWSTDKSRFKKPKFVLENQE